MNDLYSVQVMDREENKEFEAAFCPAWSVNDVFDAIVQKFPTRKIRVLSPNGTVYGRYEKDIEYSIEGESV